MGVLPAQLQAGKACAGPGGSPRMKVQRPWGPRVGGLVMDVIHALFCTTAFLLVLGMGRGGETPQQDGGNLQFHHESGARG